jgi:hypothetical protein
MDLDGLLSVEISARGVTGRLPEEVVRVYIIVCVLLAYVIGTKGHPSELTIRILLPARSRMRLSGSGDVYVI